MTANRLLLDVNALLALGWAEHEAHKKIVSRLSISPTPLWATCSITQLGFIRISSTNGIFSQTLNPKQAQSALDALCRDKQHLYLEQHPSVLNYDFSSLTGPRQTTDAYLLTLAQHHDMQLLTLDKRLANAFPNMPFELIT